MKGTIPTSKDLDQTCNLCHRKPAGAQDTLLLMAQSAELLEIAEESVAALKAKGEKVGEPFALCATTRTSSLLYASPLPQSRPGLGPWNTEAAIQLIDPPVNLPAHF